MVNLDKKIPFFNPRQARNNLAQLSLLQQVDQLEWLSARCLIRATLQPAIEKNDQLINYF
jgi:hypothetical protein